MNKKIIVILIIMLLCINYAAAQCNTLNSRFDTSTSNAIADIYEARIITHKINQELFNAYNGIRQESIQNSGQLGQDVVDRYMGIFEDTAQSYLEEADEYGIIASTEDPSVEGFLTSIGTSIASNTPILGEAIDTISFLSTTVDIADALLDAESEIYNVVNEFTTQTFHQVYSSDDYHTQVNELIQLMENSQSSWRNGNIEPGAVDAITYELQKVRYLMQTIPDESLESYQTSNSAFNDIRYSLSEYN